LTDISGKTFLEKESEEVKLLDYQFLEINIFLGDDMFKKCSSSEASYVCNKKGVSTRNALPTTLITFIPN